jgi:hypothetical protein
MSRGIPGGAFKELRNEPRISDHVSEREPAMRTSVFKVAVVLVLCVVGWGFYSGWFVLSRQDSGRQDSKVNVTLTVDTDKAKADAKAVEAKVKGLTATAPDKDTNNRAKAKDKQ